MINESLLRRFQPERRDPGSSVGMPNFRAPEEQAYANRRVANESTTQPAAYAQSQSTGTGIGGNMQPPSASSTFAEAGVENTWPDTKGNIPNPPNGYNPQLARTGSPEDKAQETLARYVAMIKEAQQKQA